MRLGIRTLAVLALIGCSSNDIPNPAGTGSTSHTDVTGSWTLTWGPMTGEFVVLDTTKLIIDTTVNNTVTPPDTTIDTTAVTNNRLVFDTCNASGTMSVTQAFRVDTILDTTVTPPVLRPDTSKLASVGDVVGKYTMTRTCNDTLVFPDSALGDTVPARVARAHTDSAWQSLVTSGNVFYMFLDNNPTPHDNPPPPAKSATGRVPAFKQGQQATVTGTSMTGVAVWANIRFKHSPKDPTAKTVPLTGTFSATKP